VAAVVSSQRLGSAIGMIEALVIMTRTECK
jgi:hypothetical protein